MTHRSYRVLTDKLTRSVGQELWGIYSNNNRQFAGNLPRTHQRFSEICDIFVIMSLSDSDKNELGMIFDKFAENFPTGS